MASLSTPPQENTLANLVSNHESVPSFALQCRRLVCSLDSPDAFLVNIICFCHCRFTNGRDLLGLRADFWSQVAGPLMYFAHSWKYASAFFPRIPDVREDIGFFVHNFLRGCEHRNGFSKTTAAHEDRRRLSRMESNIQSPLLIIIRIRK